MNKITDSATTDPTMAASIAFNSILEHIRGSNLNYQMHLSPFSANISLKNSLIKNKSGAQLLPPATLYRLSDVRTENMDNMITTNNKLREDLSALQSKFEDVLAKYEAAQNEVNKLKENLLSVEENSKNEVKEKKVLKKLRQKARLNAEKVEGITEFGYESPRIDQVRCVQSLKHPSTPSSPHTPAPGTPPPSGPCPASHHSHLPVKPTSPPRDLPACSSPCSTSSETNRAETETVLFEGNLISKQDFLKKILEAVQEVNNNFNP